LLLARDRLPNGIVDLLYEGGIQIRRDDDVLLPHLLNISIRLLILSARIEELNQLGKHISKPDSFVHSWRVNQLVAKHDHRFGVTILEDFPCLYKLFNDSNSIAHHFLLHLLALRCCFI
jgi:hypothetical protein